MLFSRSRIALAAVCLTASPALAAPVDSFTTVFGPGGASGSVPAASVLNGLDGFTQFAVPGAIVDDDPADTLFEGTADAGGLIFFQNGNFYVGGAGPAAGHPLAALGEATLGGPLVNNRSFGVVGLGRTDIIFEEGVVESLVLQARGTEEGLSVGATAPGTTLPNSTPLADADGTLLVFTDLGLATSIAISNEDFSIIPLDAALLGGSSITRISLINESFAGNSAVVLGELTANVAAVPTPAAAGMGLVGLSLLGLRRRRQQG